MRCESRTATWEHLNENRTPDFRHMLGGRPGLLVGGFYSVQHTRQFLRTAVEAPGVVTENLRQESSSSDRSGLSWSYYPRIRFRTSDGQEIDFISNTGTNPPVYRVNEPVTVLYDPRQPQHASIKSFAQVWMLSIILFGVGALLSSVGIGQWCGRASAIARTHGCGRTGAASRRRSRAWSWTPPWRSLASIPIASCANGSSGQERGAYLPQRQHLVRSHQVHSGKTIEVLWIRTICAVTPLRPRSCQRWFEPHAAATFQRRRLTASRRRAGAHCARWPWPGRGCGGQ